MISVSFDVKTTYNVAAAARLAGDTCQNLVTEFVNTGTNYATLRTPVGTGRLRAGNTGEVDAPSGFRCEGRMVNATAYALDVHQGTPPHRIEPKRASVLRFEAGGEVVFAAYVSHPGTAARPFLAEGAAAAAAELNFIFRPTVNQ